ncbi:TetR/AcrR family transcriptional regulator [Pseudonocardia sp. KRD291]|uniref:TetR/AcrR family transcriptional regulator n=1 Tax=Pseudonocardia sp. KRD291 TaxID=2792007 RepID=UPI001C5C4A10|nr:TetR/AcrR family transcriptional regulator [Pseudonocardia sp. KRD291]MBW0105114.1 TetR/AcrR family transcriptional regulator [Pseudonocardia sp. KRD291]
MTEPTRRAPAGAAVLHADVTDAITEAVLDELAEGGIGRLSMEAVARRAGVGKSALYRRWSSRDEMVVAVLSGFSVPRVVTTDTGSLRGDIRAVLAGLEEWLTHPRFSRILPDLVAEQGRRPDLAAAVAEAVGEPRRERGAAVLQRAVERGELPADIDRELALDLLGAPIYWRHSVRRAEVDAEYLDALTELVLRALGAKA